MSENLIYINLNLTESTRPRLQKVTDAQGCTYAEVKVQSLDTNAAASYTSSGDKRKTGENVGPLLNETGTRCREGSVTECCLCFSLHCSGQPSGPPDFTDPGCHTDTINFKDSRQGKSCCSRRRVTVLIAVIILLLVLAVGLILMYHPTASSPPDSKTFSTTSEEALETGRDPQWSGENDKQNCTGCPQDWEKHGGKCYFFSQTQEKNDWNASRKECTDKNSDLVIIDNEDELNYLTLRSTGHYYLLGLTYSQSEKKWKWINNMEYDADMFHIGGDFTDYFCTVIGHSKVETASCDGSTTTQIMCEKAADIS